MRPHRLSELVRVRELRASLAKSEAARACSEHAKAQDALLEIRQRIAELERQAHSWQLPEAASGDPTMFDAGYMHNLMSCRDQAQMRAREAAASLPRAELARQRAHAAAREARQIWSHATRRADVIARQLKDSRRNSRRRQQDREEEQLIDERRRGVRIADIESEDHR